MWRWTRSMPPSTNSPPPTSTRSTPWSATGCSTGWKPPGAARSPGPRPGGPVGARAGLPAGGHLTGRRAARSAAPKPAAASATPSSSKPRTTLTGEPVPPLLPATAKAWHAGLLDGEHLEVIQKFFRDLPDHIAPAEIEKAERSLAKHAVELRPDQLQKVANRLALTLNPDGTFSDDDRARKRGFTWCGGQRVDGMSVGKLIATPEQRAMLDAWFAKFAQLGMCNPDDQSPTVDQRAHRGGRPARRPQPAPTPARRAERPGARTTRGSDTRPAQRLAGDRHRLRDSAGHPGPDRARRHRRRHPAADVGRDPDVDPRLPLPGPVRRRHRPSPVAGPHQTHRHRRPTNRPARQRPWLHPTRL